MDLKMLWRISPPSRLLTHPYQMDYDIEQLKLKQNQQSNSMPKFTDSNDLIQFLKSQLTGDFKELNPFDLISKIHYTKHEYENTTKYYYEVSRPIHYGSYNQEKSFIIKTDKTQEQSHLQQMYQNKLKRVLNQKEVRLTYEDVMIINRRLLQHSLRIFTRKGDNLVVVTRYDWVNNKLL